MTAPLDVAWRIAARHVAARAVAGTIAPYDAADSLYTLWIDQDLPRELGTFPGLIDAWEYGGVFGSREEVDAEIVKACEQLLVETEDPLPAPEYGVPAPGSGEA